MSWFNVVLPVVTLIAGYVGTFATEAWREDRATERAREDRTEVRRERHEGERRAFELETLRASQDAVATLGRACGKAHFHDMMQAREAGSDQYKNSLLPGDVSAELYEANRRLARLEDLIMDDGIRDRVSAFRDAVAQWAADTGSTVQEGELLFITSVNRIDPLQKALGARIREIYAGTVDLREPQAGSGH